MSEALSPAEVEKAARWVSAVHPNAGHVGALLAYYRQHRPADPTPDEVPDGWELELEDGVGVYRWPCEGEWYLADEGDALMRGSALWGGASRFILRRKEPSPVKRLAKALAGEFDVDRPRWVKQYIPHASSLLSECPDLFHPDLVAAYQKEQA